MGDDATRRDIGQRLRVGGGVSFRVDLVEEGRLGFHASDLARQSMNI